MHLSKMRICFGCGSTKTYIDKGGHLHWYGIDWFVRIWFCENCNNKYFKNPKSLLTRHPRRVVFRKKQIQLSFNPRTGHCSLCPNNVYDGSCKKTAMHHIEYHDEDPLKGTVELCNSCHRKYHNEYRKIIAP